MKDQSDIYKYMDYCIKEKGKYAFAHWIAVVGLPEFLEVFDYNEYNAKRFLSKYFTKGAVSKQLKKIRRHIDDGINLGLPGILPYRVKINNDGWDK